MFRIWMPAVTTKRRRRASGRYVSPTGRAVIRGSAGSRCGRCTDPSQRYPQSRVWGFGLELRPAAKIAAGQLDKVLAGKCEDSRPGVGRLAARQCGWRDSGVPEHMHNRGRRWSSCGRIAGQGTVVVSAQCYFLSGADGIWRLMDGIRLAGYHPYPLLYLRRIAEVFSETGYRVNKTIYGILMTVCAVCLRTIQGLMPDQYRYRKMVNQTSVPPELHELCSLQFIWKWYRISKRTGCRSSTAKALQGFASTLQEHQLSEQEAQQF